MSDFVPSVRPRFHFTPERHWLNDPNGLVYVDGVYHLFFQHNPEAIDWGNMSWGHATSTDLLTWDERPVAIRWDDEEDVWSGSVVVDNDNVSGLGADGAPVLVAIYTSNRRDGIQAQSLASSVDGGETWIKYPGNPVLDRRSNGFRDPKVLWFTADDGSGYWVMVAVEAESREVVIYRSDDLIRWDYLSTFGPAGATEGIWECPDLFELRVDGGDKTAWVLILSVGGYGPNGGTAMQYFVGDFDGTAFTPQGADGAPRWMDGGRDFYAAVTFFGAPDDRRIAIAWMSNAQYAAHIPTSPWRGAMSVPRELTLEIRAGLATLVQRPVAELAALGRAVDAVVVQDAALAAAIELPVPSQYRLDIEARVGDTDAFVMELCGLVFSYTPADGILACERLAAGARAVAPEFAGVSRAAVRAVGGVLSVTVIVDECSVELFAADGELAMTHLFFGDSPDGVARLRSVGAPARLVSARLTPLGGS